MLVFVIYMILKTGISQSYNPREFEIKQIKILVYWIFIVVLV